MYKFQTYTSLSAVTEELGDLVLVRSIFSLFSFVLLFNFKVVQLPFLVHTLTV